MTSNKNRDMQRRFIFFFLAFIITCNAYSQVFEQLIGYKIFNQKDSLTIFTLKREIDVNHQKLVLAWDDYKKIKKMKIDTINPKTKKDLKQLNKLEKQSFNVLAQLYPPLYEKQKQLISIMLAYREEQRFNARKKGSKNLLEEAVYYEDAAVGEARNADRYKEANKGENTEASLKENQRIDTLQIYALKKFIDMYLALNGVSKKGLKDSEEKDNKELTHIKNENHKFISRIKRISEMGELETSWAEKVVANDTMIYYNLKKIEEKRKLKNDPKFINRFKNEKDKKSAMDQLDIEIDRMRDDTARYSARNVSIVKDKCREYDRDFYNSYINYNDNFTYLNLEWDSRCKALQSRIIELSDSMQNEFNLAKSKLDSAFFFSYDARRSVMICALLLEVKLKEVYLLTKQFNLKDQFAECFKDSITITCTENVILTNNQKKESKVVNEKKVVSTKKTGKIVYKENKVGVVFKVQLFEAADELKKFDFKGLYPVYSQKNTSGKTGYYYGEYSYYHQAEAGLKLAKNKGFAYPKIHAFDKNGNQLSIDQANKLIDKGYVNTINDEKKEIDNKDDDKFVIQNKIDAVSAIDVKQIKGIVFLIQIGYFDKPAVGKDVKYLTPLYLERNSDGYKYMAGIYDNYKLANKECQKIISKYAIKDAFVVGYIDGVRKPLDEVIKISQKKN